METKLHPGDASYTLYDNSIIQAYTRQAYHKSGGFVSPGTSATNITTQVDKGKASINDTAVSWVGEELQHADAGVGRNGQDTNNPRVDVIYATQAGALAIAQGKPAPYAPDTDVDGNPLTPAPFGHWSPSPDGGTNVGGVVLALVLVKPDWTSAQDMSDAEIRQWKLGASDSSVFVRGDGSDNEKIVVATSGDDVTFEDTTLQNGEWLDYDASADKLHVGSSDVEVWAENLFNMRNNPITGLATPSGSAQATNKRYVDNNDEKLLPLDGSRKMTADLNMGGNDIVGLSGPSSEAQATNKRYVDNNDEKLLPLDGSRKMTGDIVLDNNQILGAKRYAFLGTGGGVPPRIYPGNDGNLVYQTPDGSTYPFAGPTAP